MQYVECESFKQYIEILLGFNDYTESKNKVKNSCTSLFSDPHVVHVLEFIVM